MKTFDVAIAGGGLIGGSIAVELAQAGLRVAVFDQSDPGREASWAGAGILSPAPENAATIPMVPLAKASMALHPKVVENVEEISGQPEGCRPNGTLLELSSRASAVELTTLSAPHHVLG